MEEPAGAGAADNEQARVQVVARVRPVLAHENAQDVAVTVSREGTAVQVLLPDRGALKEQLPSNASQPGAKLYHFDACLPGSTTQAELAEVCGIQELVSAALDGYCVTIFAFGQTGSGKTHSMIGERLSRAAALGQHGSSSLSSALVEQEDGLLPRCLDAAYAGIEARSDQADFTVTGSCLELYNEAVTDLLAQDRAKPLQVRKEEGGGFKVEGLTQMPCKTGSAAVKAMAGALAHRHTRAHALNDYSSRSHCLMTFNFASKEKAKEGEAQGVKGGLRKYGKLVLVDLAGSERLKESGTSGREAVRETGAINRSLFTLGQVLAALAVRSGREGWDARTATPVHVPYRDSKLTQLLWDGLKGSGRALMLACLAPMRAHAEETLNTLHFASMALRIKARPVILLDPQDQLVVDLRTTIRELREENRALAAAMSALSSGTDPASVLGMLPDRLRVAAARDRLPSAPAPSTSPGGPSSSPLLVKGPLGSASPVRRRGGGPGGAGRGAGGSSPPWQSDNGGGPGRSRAADVLRLSYQHHHPLATGGSPGAALATSLGTAAYNSLATPPLNGGSPHQRPPPRGAPGAHYAAGPAAAAASSSASPGSVMAARRAPRPSLSPGGGDVDDDGGRGKAKGGGPSSPGPPDSFPELAALEAQFKDLVAGGRGFQGAGNERGGGGDVGVPEPAPPAPPPPEPEIVPEPKALHWAERNTWFGSDEEMTAAAYEVHDELIASGMDAASDEYYDAIEARVSSKFPDKWAAWEAEVEERRRREEEEKAARAAAKAAAAKRHVYRPAPGHNFGSALRVALKESMPALPPAPLGGGALGSSAGPFAPQRHYVNTNGHIDHSSSPPVPQPQASSSEVQASRRPMPAWGAGPGVVQSPKAAMAAAASIQPGRRAMANINRQSAGDPPPLTNGGVQGQGSTSSVADSAAAGRSSRPSPSRARTSAASRLIEGVTYQPQPTQQQQQQQQQQQVQPAISHQPQPASSQVILPHPSSSSKSPVPWQGAGSPAGGAGQKLLLSRGDLPGVGWQIGGDAGWRELQVEYLRQRQVVLLELQAAKAEAEAERQRILAKIGSTLANSRWRG